MLEKSDENGLNDIAIVGMALRVLGARTVGELGNNLVAGIRDVSVEELIEAGESTERIHQPDYVRRTAEMPDRRCLQANRNSILEDNCWSPHLSRPWFVKASGNHDTMVLEPHARARAKPIGRIINNGETETAKTNRPSPRASVLA